MSVEQKILLRSVCIQGRQLRGVGARKTNVKRFCKRDGLEMSAQQKTTAERWLYVHSKDSIDLYIVKVDSHEVFTRGRQLRDVCTEKETGARFF